MLKACANADNYVPLVVLVLSPGATPTVKKLSPRTKVIARPVWPDYPPDGWRFSQAWFDTYIGPAKPYLSSIDYVQFLNEHWPGNDQSGAILYAIRDFYMALMKACEAVGTHCTVLDLAFGNMADDRHAPEPNQFAIMKPMLQYAAAHGHVLNYHAYNSVNDVHDPRVDKDAFTMRWVHWVKQVPGLKVAIGEYLVPEWKDPKTGEDARLLSPENTVWQMEEFDKLVRDAIKAGDMPGDCLIGACAFTDNAGDRWRNYDMNSAIPLQAKYLIGQSANV